MEPTLSISYSGLHKVNGIVIAEAAGILSYKMSGDWRTAAMTQVAKMALFAPMRPMPRNVNQNRPLRADSNSTEGLFRYDSGGAGK